MTSPSWRANLHSISPYIYIYTFSLFLKHTDRNDRISEPSLLAIRTEKKGWRGGGVGTPRARGEDGRTGDWLGGGRRRRHFISFRPHSLTLFLLRHTLTTISLLHPTPFLLAAYPPHVHRPRRDPHHHHNPFGTLSKEDSQLLIGRNF